MLEIVREVVADVTTRSTNKLVVAKQNDAGSRFLNVRIRDGGKSLDMPSNSIVILNVQRPDSSSGTFYGSVNEVGTVKVELNSWILEQAGTLACDISVVDENSTKLTTMTFYVEVEAAVCSDNYIVETEEYSVIVDLLNRTTAAEESARQTAESARQTAESARQTAESAEQVKEACEEATKAANEAAEFAISSVGKDIVYDATPETLAHVMSIAVPQSTIRLAKGNYPLLTFTGEHGLARADTDNPLPGTVLTYPENLTLVGGEGVTMAGVSITSGVDSIVAYTGGADIASFILPKGLTLRDLTLSDSFSLRNGVVDNLSIIDCHFTKGIVSVTPNEFADMHGSDVSQGASNPHHYDYVGLKMRDIVVKGCTFDDATITSTTTAICILSVENIEISENYVVKAGWNGIQINGSSGQPCSGKIRIFNNRITNTDSQAINVNYLENAELYVIGNRVMNIAMETSGGTDVIRANNLKNTTTQWCINGNEGANYNANFQTYMTRSDCITVSNEVNDRLLAQGESAGWTWKKWENGEAECYGRFSIRGVVRDWITQDVPLPFDLVDSNNAHVMVSIVGTNSMEAVLIMASKISKNICVEIAGAVSTSTEEYFTIALQVKGRWK